MSEHSMSFYDTLKEAKQIPGIEKQRKRSAVLLPRWKPQAMAYSEEYSMKDLIGHILEDTGYEEELPGRGRD